VLVTPWDGVDGLGREVMRWLLAVPLACAQLGVDPFDQPDVAAAKVATAAALEAGTELEGPVELAAVEDALSRAGYVALLAYVDPDAAIVTALAGAAHRLSRRIGVPVTLGIGPRYLHSTGQFHKGGRRDGLHLVLVGDDPVDVPIPGRTYGFSRLKRAQAAGDLAALRDAGRRAHRIALDDPMLLGPSAGASSR
jgi:transaldolase / glucose-6-phosphate isomerase